MKFNSCEVKYYRFRFIVFMIVTFVLIIPFLILLLIFDENKESNIVFYLFFIILIPFNFYYGYRYHYFKKLEPKYIQESVLVKAESSLTRLVRFSVDLVIEGKVHKKETLAIFFTGFIGPNLVGDYSNKKVLVGYDEIHDCAVVLKLLE